MANFSNEYQGGVAFEVFTPQGSNPLNNWKITGPGSKGTKKVYEKDVKGYIFNCPGGHGFKMQFPRDDRKSLCLLQPYINLQIYVSGNQQFSLELSVTTTDNTRRRLFVSSSFQDVKATALHAQIPLKYLRRDGWTNLVFHHASLVEGCFPKVTFRSLDLMVISGCFKLRRIFTLKQPPPDTVSQHVAGTTVPVPVAMDYPPGVPKETQVMDALLLLGTLPKQLVTEARKAVSPQLVARRSDPHDGAAIALDLGIQGEASPPAKRAPPQVRAQRSARMDQGGVDSRIPGPPTSPAPKWAQHHSLPLHAPPEANDLTDDGRRAQSAAIQRQGTNVHGAADPPLAGSKPSSRKVVSAAGGVSGIRTRSQVARASAAPPRVNIDPFMPESMSPASPRSPSSGQISAWSPHASGVAGGPAPPQQKIQQRRHSNSTTASPSAFPSSPVLQKAGGGSNSFNRRMDSSGSSPALPDLAGVGVEVSGSLWGTDIASPVLLSSSSMLGKPPSMRYSGTNPLQKDHSQSPGADSSRKFWGDVSHMQPEDVPLHRQLDHLQMSPTACRVGSALSPASGVASPTYPGRVAPLTQQPVLDTAVSFSGPRAGNRMPPTKRTLALESSPAPLGAAMEPTMITPARSLVLSSALCMPPITVNSSAVLPDAVQSTSPKASRMKESLSSPCFGLAALPESVAPLSSINSSCNRVALKSIERYGGGQLVPPDDGPQAVCSTVLEDPLAEEPGCRRSGSSGSSACEIDEEDSAMYHDAQSEYHQQTATGFLEDGISAAANSNSRADRQAAADAAIQESVSRQIIQELPVGPFQHHGVGSARSSMARGDFEPQGSLEVSPRAPDSKGAEDRDEKYAISEDTYTAVQIINHQRAYTPPVVPPSQVQADSGHRDQKDGGGARHHGASADGSGKGALEGDSSIEFMDLIYDPILNCYYDSKSNQYFSLK
mmetsp:Transcript_20844/g.57835  ORF Transcript_20844/g.57835 Transcript_20844/m.57835 type:complete len:945 (+) Transcript_20844:71-2905(+)|eukprot:CAMPEP_0117666832 /NCGR_PEP_ID=MMETSP0804-20121206/10604_1 /TAXON_ID=1074897 /ORGANISM="Tetraselmis astigmatica, Strain CCMP880" /LENGTH=944 /DNA_ID=CAMNT_0005474439 /DNA_START=58 /DNA_END=2892 /DNA_ORIENTATION=-